MIRSPPKGIGAAGNSSSDRWGRNYDNNELFPALECSDYEVLVEKLAAIGVRPHRDDLNRPVCHVARALTFAVRAESFYREHWESIDKPKSARSTRWVIGR